MKNQDIETIHRVVSKVRQDKEVSIGYMKSWERDAMMRDEGRQEGREEGRKLGMQTVILNMLKRGMSDEDICALAECEQNMVDEVREKQLI